MTTITDSKGNVIREEPDTLEDWKQAAEVEAGLRREFQKKYERLRARVRESLRVSGLDMIADQVTKLHAIMNEP